MNLYAKLHQRKDNPLRIGLIGAGKFAAMYLAQVPKTPGVELVGIADLSPANARENLKRVGWDPDRLPPISEDWQKLVANPKVDIIIEATGNPPAAVEHALYAFSNRKHVVMVTVEADAFCGPILARKAAEAGVVYSLAYGDQPALICDLVDWARTAGFQVVAAGRGHKWLPHFAQSTPETVWGHYGLTPEQAKVGGLNPKMFNSFLDGSKPAIETSAVCNATGLTPAPEGLNYPPGAIDEIPSLMRPREEGGVLHHKGQVEVVSSLRRDGTPIPYDIRFGVFVVFEGETDYIRRCFEEYGVKTDPSGRYACLYKRWHLIGLEVGISVASVGLRREPTGCATGFRADVVATAKRDLKAGEMLDGEGGYTVYGKLFPAEESLKLGGLPLGLAHEVKLLNPVTAGQPVRWTDVQYDAASEAVKIRREMEREFAPAQRAAHGRRRPPLARGVLRAADIDASRRRALPGALLLAAAPKFAALRASRRGRGARSLSAAARRRSHGAAARNVGDGVALDADRDRRSQTLSPAARLRRTRGEHERLPPGDRRQGLFRRRNDRRFRPHAARGRRLRLSRSALGSRRDRPSALSLGQRHRPFRHWDRLLLRR